MRARVHLDRSRRRQTRPRAGLHLGDGVRAGRHSFAASSVGRRRGRARGGRAHRRDVGGGAPGGPAAPRGDELVGCSSREDGAPADARCAGAAHALARGRGRRRRSRGRIAGRAASGEPVAARRRREPRARPRCGSRSGCVLERHVRRLGGAASFHGGEARGAGRRRHAPRTTAGAGVVVARAGLGRGVELREALPSPSNGASGVAVDAARWDATAFVRAAARLEGALVRHGRPPSSRRPATRAS